MRYVWFSMFMLAALPVAARAEVLQLDKLSVDLALPKDYCKLSRADPNDKLRYNQQDQANGGQNVLLMLAVPCNELTASRAGKLWQHWAIWLQIGSKPVDIPLSMSHTEAFTQIAKEIPAVDLKTVSNEINGRTKGIDIKLSSNGSVGQDGNGLYAVMVGDASSATVKRTVANVYAFTVLSGRIFTFNLYQDYENSKTLDTLLASVKDVAQRSTAATDGLQKVH
jgi:hypothetical protein